MKNYTLHYRQTIDGVESESPLFWRCLADDYEHDVEQLQDAIRSEGETVVFVEFYKN